jgi:hypothetical protein
VKALEAVGAASLLLAAAGPVSPGSLVTVAAVGDLMLGTTDPVELLPPGDGARAFEPAAGLLRGRDLVFGNLEGPLLEGGSPAKCGLVPSGRCFEFRMPPRYALTLAQAGFNVLNVANNHAFDFGLPGVESTVRLLGEAGISAVGGEQVARRVIGGKRVAVVGFSTSPPSAYSHSLLDLDRAREVVRALAAESDLVVVSFHGGAEGKGALHVADAEESMGTERRGNVLRFARALVEEGADLVLGHGPHVPRALELHQGKLIAYSLGNFLTFGRFNTSGPNGLGYVLQLELDGDSGRLVSGAVASVDLTADGLPAPDPQARAAALVRDLTREDLGGGGLRFTTGGRFEPAQGAAPEAEGRGEAP